MSFTITLLAIQITPLSMTDAAVIYQFFVWQLLSS
jgi:hypothetical protein